MPKRQLESTQGQFILNCATDNLASDGSEWRKCLRSSRLEYVGAS